eukprot:NODE_1069_length_1027_cov_47.371111_g1024_i0.p1 GENE.NODE_1069_length_1027_cov_47.371111_g1024_i0~~NODE_1069_length_1027_cov_47.371111_g1024_i0.p1  ORF type:complete len:206 (+),score=51.83 NODE_1069_length_1027_cov_47.371111_g1024_i0:45-620(+)
MPAAVMYNTEMDSQPYPYPYDVSCCPPAPYQPEFGYPYDYGYCNCEQCNAMQYVPQQHYPPVPECQQEIVQPEPQRDIHHVHDPYSFEAYYTFTAPEKPAEIKPTQHKAPAHVPQVAQVPAAPVKTPAPVPAPTEERPAADDAIRKAIQEQRKARVVPPCGHDNFKRLRFKKGFSHYLCLDCSTKWRQAGV